jgi:hypothetical protein
MGTSRFEIELNWSRYKQQVPEIRQYIILCTQAVVLA